MNPAQLLAHFDRISHAPDAIPSLRRFILDLAVRGKLVEQDPRDEPASELLKRIEDGVRERKAHGEPTEPRNAIDVAIDSLPFTVPPSWRWTRLIQIADVSYGFAFESSRFNSNKVGMPLIRIRDISGTDTQAYYQGEHDPAYVVTKGDYLVGMDGDFNVRKWKGPDALLNQRVMRIKNWQAALVAEFLAIPLQMILDHLHALTSQTTVKHLSAKHVNGIYISIPPLAEQHRIVAKVDELMALCDRLETAQVERESRRDRLVASSLNRLNNGEAADTFHDHARFYLNHLPRLTTKREHIQQLRQTILNLAFRGLIVSQYHDDEPGTALLQRIASQDSQKRRVGGRRRENRPPLTPLDCKGIFETPKNWAWTHLDFLCESIADVDHNMPKAVSDGVPFISAKDLKDDGTIDFTAPKMISEDDYQRLSRKVQMRRDDIVYSRIGARLGKARLVNVDTRFLISYSCCLVRPLHAFIDKHYLRSFLDSTLALSQAHKGTQSIGVPDLGLGEIKAFKIPLPPLDEQRRIVAKVDELMALCDRLETQLTTTHADSLRLLNAVLHDALAPAG
ncbi:MAG: restriction endonuclease subunit S [Nitrospira sp.]|nr:restriction endonuclease subunit S [Nitrospira sp.]